MGELPEPCLHFADYFREQCADVAGAEAMTRAAVTSAHSLLAAGNTVPFLARYRVDVLGASESVLRAIEAAGVEWDAFLGKRKRVWEAARKAGGLDADVVRAVRAARHADDLEAIAARFRAKVKSAVTKLKEADPALFHAAARLFADRETGTANDVAAVLGKHGKDDVMMVVASEMGHDVAVRADMRKHAWKSGRVCAKLKSKLKATPADPAMYLDFSAAVRTISPVTYLAVRRLKANERFTVRFELDMDHMVGVLRKTVYGKSPVGHTLTPALRLAYSSHVRPFVVSSIERELETVAHRRALDVFAVNLRNLLLAPPFRASAPVLAIDPGFAAGCKIAVVSPDGADIVHTATLALTTGSKDAMARAAAELVRLLDSHGVGAIALGNGTACRKVETILQHEVLPRVKHGKVQYVMVSEAGASVYSCSPLAAEEMPERTPLERGAVTIGRRLLDPMSELVKVPAASLGVGQYQHDLKAKDLDAAVAATLESAVAEVGVSVNSASAVVLQHVPGLNGARAKAIVAHRAGKRLSRRSDLLAVAGIGPRTYEQAAGFLRVPESKEPLDSSNVHPDMYDVARDVKRDRAAAEAKHGKERVDMVATQLAVAHDPRTLLPGPLFRSGLTALADLRPGMELRGTVGNVTDFGAFVDCGLETAGLVHVSKYVDGPPAAGQRMDVVVASVDVRAKRVGLVPARRADGTRNTPPGEPRADRPAESFARKRSASGGGGGGKKRAKKGR